MRFVVGSFLDSMRAAWTAGLIQMDDWTDVMGPQMEKLFARPGSEVTVAYAPREVDPGADVYGWLAQERGHPFPFVVYCYVKAAYRRLGIARKLFEAAHVNPMGAFKYATWMERDLAAKVPRARWSPLTARFERRAHVEGSAQRREPRADQDRGGQVRLAAERAGQG